MASTVMIADGSGNEKPVLDHLGFIRLSEAIVRILISWDHKSLLLTAGSHGMKLATPSLLRTLMLRREKDLTCTSFGETMSELVYASCE